ncbi:hypothetical protein AHF37_09359 [Paragonimus kellicotti]|nr:hypothetical protein AHF37_09359 [Paragonimus kellicotti]
MQVNGFEAVHNWNRTRDRLVRILYYHCSSCVEEGLLSPDELDDLFLCELAASTSGALAQFLDDSNARSYTDILPSVASKGDQPELLDLWLMTKFCALQQFVLTNCPVVCHTGRVLWRKPNGMNKKFHREYLTQFCSAFKQAALLAIDGRAIKKLELLLSPQGHCSNLDTSPSTSVASGYQQVGNVLRLVFPEPYNPQNHLARRLQCKMRTWDRAWNTVAQFGTVSPMAESHRKEVDTILSYLTDTTIGSDAPMFVYSTCKTEQNGKQNPTPHLANAIAAAAFIEAQKTFGETSNVVMLGCMVREPNPLTQTIEDLADQLGYALDLDREHIQTNSLAALLNSLSKRDPKTTVAIFILGVDKLIDADGSGGDDKQIPPILQASQLPYCLRPGVKLVMTTELCSTSSTKHADDAVLLPSISLNREVQEPSVSDAFTVCMVALAAENRCLTDAQMSGIHKLFSQLCHRPDMLQLAVIIGKYYLPYVRSNSSLDCHQVLKWIAKSNEADLLDRLFVWHGLRTLEYCVDFLKLASGIGGKPTGLTNEELADLLSLSDQVMWEHAESKESTTVFFETARVQLILNAMTQCKMIFCELQPLTSSLDGHFVHYFGQSMEQNEISSQLYNAAEVMVEYIINIWSLNPKPLQIDLNNRLFANRIHSQSVYFKSDNHVRELRQNGMEFNLRYIRHIPLVLLYTGQYILFCTRTVFNFSWLYGTLYALGIKELLDLLGLFDRWITCVQHIPSGELDQVAKLRLEMSLLRDALNRSSGTLNDYPELLPTELAGQLLPFTRFCDSENSDHLGIWINSLVKQCDQAIPWYSVLLPLHPYSVVPGNSLIGNITCQSPLATMFISPGGENEMIANELFIRFEKDPKIYRYDCNSNKQLEELEAGFGDLYCSPSGRFGVVLATDKSDTIKVHRLDCQEMGRVPLIGQIHTGLWISRSWSNRQLEDEAPMLRTNILDIDLTDTYVALVAQTKNIDSLTERMQNQESIYKKEYQVSESLAPGTSNHVAIFELTTGNPVQLLSPSPKANLVKLVPELCDSSTSASSCSSNNEHHSLFITNSGDTLFCFRVISGEQTLSVSLGATPKLLRFGNQATQLFALCHGDTSSLVYIQLTHWGTLKKSHKASFQSILKNDVIVNIKSSTYFSTLLIHSQKHILIYDYEADTVRTTIERPDTIPVEFRLPNSSFQPLVFTAAEFALRDQVIAAAIFRNVIIWDIRLGAALATLNAPLGALTRLLVDSTEKQVIGYAGAVRELYLWNIPLALTNATLTQNSHPSCLGNANKMDRLTRPIVEIIIPPTSRHLLARCVDSDELGLFDLETGRLMDLYTHNAIVQTVVVSACGQYALIELNVDDTHSVKYVNLVWSLANRTVLTEYGKVSSYILAPHKCPALFLQLVPRLQLSSECMRPECYNLIRIRVKADAQIQVSMDPVSDVELPEIVPHSRPFITEDDRYLVALVSGTYDPQRNLYADTKLGVVQLNKLQDNTITSTVPFYVTKEELSTAFPESLKVKHILSCEPMTNNFGLLIMTTTLDPLHPESVQLDWTTGKGMDKSVLVAQFSDSNKLNVFRRIESIPFDSRSFAFHYTPVNNTVYDSDQQVLYHLGRQTESTLHLDNGKRVAELVSSAADKNPVDFHGFASNDTICVFSFDSFVYLIRIDPCDVLTRVDTHNPITCIGIASTRDNVLFVGSQNGYLQTYLITDPISTATTRHSVMDFASRATNSIEPDRLYRENTIYPISQPTVSRAHSLDPGLGRKLCTLQPQKCVDAAQSSECFSQNNFALSAKKTRTCTLM